MRCLILIALCLAVANATYFNNRNRFNRMLKQREMGGGQQYGQQYGQRYGQQYGQQQQEYDGENMFGSDDLDNQMDEIRRGRSFGGRDQQCTRGEFEGGMNEEDDEQCNKYDNEYENEDGNDMDNEYRRNRYSQMGNDDEEQFRGQYSEEDDEMTTGRRQQQPHRRYPTDMEDEESTMNFEEGRRGQFGGEDDETETRQPVLKEVNNANIRLATRLYKQCKLERDDKNIVVSPLAVQFGCVGLIQGTRGVTKRQIGRVIGGPLPLETRKHMMKSLVRHFKKTARNSQYSSGQSQQTKINIVTGLFVAKTTRAQQHFIQHVNKVFGATIKQCAFSHQPQQCRRQINQWMSTKTQHKINQICPQDAITDNTKMVLVNSLELKATWGPQIRRHITTKTAKFYPLDSRKPKPVEVLETEGKFKYYEDELVKIVGLPTKQREMTLYAIVPKDKDGLTEVEKLHLADNIQLKELLEKTDKHPHRRVHVQLPKFQIKHKVDVRRTLRKQGVTDVFDPLRADFSRMTEQGIRTYEHESQEQGHSSDYSDGRNPFSQYGSQYESQSGKPKIHLNKFIHQCTIKVTEQGITAVTGNQQQGEEDQYESYGRRHHQQQQQGGDFESEDMFEQYSGMFRRGGDFEGQQGQQGQQHVVKANRAFAFVLKHNPTKQLVMIGRVIDAAQKKINHVPQSINGVDQY